MTAPEAPDALDAATIRSGLAARGEDLGVEALARCASTNSELVSRAARGTALLVADEQTAGRGRRGRRWHASPGCALMFSLRWEFDGGLERLRGLSLASGVAIAKALRDSGARAVGLKWPNDLLACVGQDGAKLGGILIETRTASGRTAAIIGVGLNCRRTPGLEARLGRGVAALEDWLDPLPPRNELAVRIVAEMARAMRVFGASGFEPFHKEWESMHAQQGAQMRVRTSDGRVVTGIADGVAPDGGLLLRNRRGLLCIHSGTVIREGPGRGAA